MVASDKKSLLAHLMASAMRKNKEGAVNMNGNEFFISVKHDELEVPSQRYEHV